MGEKKKAWVWRDYEPRAANVAARISKKAHENVLAEMKAKRVNLSQAINSLLERSIPWNQ